MRFIQLLLFFCVIVKGYSQDLSKHQWKDRLLLIYTNHKESNLLQEQLKTLKENGKGLKERKIKIYLFTSSEFSNDFGKSWQKSPVLFNRYIYTSNSFQILLVGLDGGTKLTSFKILSTKKIFALIDGMPMRKREIKNN